jgi:serine/threonine-protein kinase 11
MRFRPLLIPDRASKPTIQLNQYLFVGRLGRGTSGNVHLAIDTTSNAKVAVKSIRLSSVASVLALDREIQNMRRLSHPNIRRLIEVIHRKDNNTVYLVMEYAAASLTGHVLPEAEAASLFGQVVEGLCHLHKMGIVHQDIKPSNILITEDGQVKIADFGIGHSFASAHNVIGTPAYQAPEFLDDEFGRDPVKEDVWSLSVTIFGCLPFEGESVFEIAATANRHELQIPEAASPELRDLLTGMLAADRSEMISMEEVAKHKWLTQKSEFSIPAVVPKLKSKSPASIECISADVCGDDVLFAAEKVVISAWPPVPERGLGRVPMAC